MVGIWLWGILGWMNKRLEFLYVITITPWIANHETYIPALLPGEIFIPVGTMNWEPLLAVRTQTVNPERAMFPWNRVCYNLWCLLCKEILTPSSSTLLSRDWTLASNILRSGGWWARLLSWTRSTEYLSSASVVLGRPLESVPLPCGVRTKGTPRESCIPGCNAGSAGELATLWYPIVLPSCM